MSDRRFIGWGYRARELLELLDVDLERIIHGREHLGVLLSLVYIQPRQRLHGEGKRAIWSERHFSPKR